MTQAKIMIVEDDGIVLLFVQKLIQQLGYTVVATATSGEEAVQKAESTQPDLVIMDIRLDGAMDGIAAAKEIGSRWQIPVVFVTGHGDADTRRQGEAANPAGYLIKPFIKNNVVETIQSALQGRSTIG